MIGEPNIDFAAREADFYMTWYFGIPATATSASEEPKEILSVAETVLNCFSGIAHFHNCKLGIGSFESDLPIRETLNVDSDAELRVVDPSDKKDSLDSEISISEIDDEIEQFRSKSPGVAFVYSLTFDDVSARVSLDGFEGYITAGDTEKYKYTYMGDVLQEDVVDDPIIIEINRTRRTNESVSSWYTIKIKTVTDIWLEDTEISEQNRERLAEALECLHASLPEGERHVQGEPGGRFELIEIPHRRSLLPWYDQDETE
jgi:hypothetical protein